MIFSFLTDCPENYERGYNDSCFFFSSDAQTYQGARFNCLGVNDSDLVIIKDEPKLNYLLNRTQQLNSNGESWWIGEYIVLWQTYLNDVYHK